MGKLKKIERVSIKQVASFVASENGVSPDDALRVFNSQFSFLSNHIKKGNDKGVKLDYIGKFHKKVFIKKRGEGNETSNNRR